MGRLDRFDFFDPEVTRDPYPAFAEMREHAPLFWSEQLCTYIVTRYEDVAYALKNPALFSSTGLRIAGQQLDSFSQQDKPRVSNLVHSDPPMHTRMRGRLIRAFSPKRISALEPRVRELARGFVSEMTAPEEFELMEGLAHPLPTVIIAEMLGIEPSRRRDFKRWSDTLIFSATNLAHPHPNARRDSEEMHAYMTRIATERRERPQGDLISLLVQEDEGQDALGPEEVNAFGLLLMLAGTETVTHLLGNTVNALLRHPEQYAWLVRNPSGCAGAIEEALRYDSPVMTLLRRTTQEVELSGGRVPADATVMLMAAAANRDPRRFPDPERFDIQRDPQGQLAFGHGVHYCLGAALARLEAPAALNELLAHAPQLSFAPRQGAQVDYHPSFAVRGPKALWLRAR
jgi:cytochrome P450